MPSLLWSMIRNKIQWFNVKTYHKWNPNYHRNDSHCEREFYLKKVQFKAQRLLDTRESRAQLSRDRHFSQFLCILVDEWQIGPKSLVMKNSGNGLQENDQWMIGFASDLILSSIDKVKPKPFSSLSLIISFMVVNILILQLSHVDLKENSNRNLCPKISQFCKWFWKIKSNSRILI